MSAVFGSGVLCCIYEFEAASKRPRVQKQVRLQVTSITRCYTAACSTRKYQYYDNVIFSVIIYKPITILISIMRCAPMWQASCRLPPRVLRFGESFIFQIPGADKLHFGAFEHAHPATLTQKKFCGTEDAGCRLH